MNKYLARITIALFIIGVTSLLAITDIFASNAGPGDATSGCQSGNCVNAEKNGATWVRIPYDSNKSISLKTLLGRLSGYLAISNYSDSIVSNCKNSGGYVYTLVTPFSKTDNFSGPVPLRIPTTARLYNGFTGKTIPSVVSPDTALDIFNSAAVDGKINGYTYSDDSNMSWFCATESASKNTTYQSQTTISIDGASTSVKSGWDGFSSTSYSVSADTSEVHITTTHRLRRTDSENVRSDVGWLTFDQKNRKSSWTNTEFATGNNNTQTVTTIESEKVTLSVGENLVCRGLYHDSLVIMKADGSARAKNSSGEYSDSNACITISRPVKTNPTASTSLQFIGESTNNEIKGNATFYTNLANPGDGSIFRTADDGDKEYFARDQETSDARDYQPDNSPNILCNHFRAASPYGCQNGVPASIPDDNSYLNAKICAIPAGKESEPNGKTKTIQRTIKTPDGDETQDVVIDLFDYYWKIKSVSCSPIAKKPSFRVTGSTVYSAGKITTSRSSKVAAGPAQNKTFGSWSEYLAIAGNTVQNFGSGAALRNGSAESEFTKNSPLTIANDTSTTIGNSGIAPSNSFISGIRARFIDNDNYNHDQVYVDKNLNDTYEITLAKANELNNSGKLNIIYAKNITISSAVSTVNAWLIADNTINTCIDATEVADLSVTTCANSLTINGLAYAKNIKLYRTAGAWAGNGSADSAEIFNLTPSDYVRAYQYANTNYMQLSEVYLQELAPRI